MIKRFTGFTLIELMFAAAILSATLVIVIAVFIGCSYLVDTYRIFTIAVNDARFVLEEIKNSSYASLAAATTPPSGFATWDAWAIARLPGGGGLNNIDRPLHGLSQEVVRVTYPSGTLADPLEVLVTVNFRGRRQMINPAAPPHSVSLRTRMTNE